MRVVIIVWPDNTDYLVNELALLEGAKWNRRFYDGPIDVLVTGPWNVVEPIIPQLKEYNYRFHNGSGILRELERRYSHLYKKYPSFHFNGFMRWLALDSFFQENNYVSFDADVVITSDILQSDVLRKSSFTSTSTCLVNINEREWLHNYRDAITMMNDKPEAFEQHWRQNVDEFILEPRDAFEVNEESFVRYLSKTGRIVNKLPDDCPYWITPMHLAYRTGKLPLQHIQTPVHYERSHCGELLNGKPLGFVHFQWLFKEYLASYFMLKYVYDVHSLGRVEPWFTYLEGKAQHKDFLELQQKVRDFVAMGRMGPDFARIFTRRWVMQEFLFNRDFSEIFNDRHWHTPGFFA